MSETAVLVVGGRTTGLMMAAELARRGVAVRLVDKSAAIDPHVRANLLHSRTLEILQGLGLAERVTEGSIAERGIRVYADNELKGVAKHAPADSPFPYGLSQSQAHVEAVLEQHLADQGVRVERSVELTALSQDDQRVDATLLDAEGREESVEAQWLVGCDGAHSGTRHLAGCAFPGDRDPFPYALGDVAMSGALEEGEGYAFMHEAGDLFIFSTLPEGRRLVCASVAPGADTSEPPTLDELQSLVDERGLSGLVLADPRWLTYFQINYRLAPHYRHGRVFLAGDAAHIHSLMAGQGMNTGIQDAFNLAWKLGLFLEGRVSESVLDTYEAERRRVGEGVLEMTREVTESFEQYASLSEAERARLVEHMFVPESERLAAAQHLQEVDLDYRQSALSMEGPGAFAAGPRAGAQAPDASPLRVDGRETSLYRLFSGVNFRLFLFEGRGERASAEEIAEALHAAAPDRDWVDAFWVSTDEGLAPRGYGGVEIRDLEGALHDRYGADRPSVYLIRPDGYVAYRARGLDGVGDYLDRLRP